MAEHVRDGRVPSTASFVSEVYILVIHTRAITQEAVDKMKAALEVVSEVPLQVLCNLERKIIDRAVSGGAKAWVESGARRATLYLVVGDSTFVLDQTTPADRRLDFTKTVPDAVSMMALSARRPANTRFQNSEQVIWIYSHLWRAKTPLPWRHPLHGNVKTRQTFVLVQRTGLDAQKKGQQ